MSDVINVYSNPREVQAEGDDNDNIDVEERLDPAFYLMMVASQNIESVTNLQAAASEMEKLWATGAANSVKAGTKILNNMTDDMTHLDGKDLEIAYKEYTTKQTEIQSDNQGHAAISQGGITIISNSTDWLKQLLEYANVAVGIAQNMTSTWARV